VNAIAGLPPECPAWIGVLSPSDKIRCSRAPLSCRVRTFFACRSGIDEISIDLLLHLLDLLQHSPYGSRYPVEHSIRIIDELARVVG
jgi:hypothetical protein